MEVSVLKEEKNIVELKLDGEGHTLANLLRNELWNVDGVGAASYNISHPIIGKPVLIVSVNKGKPRKALQEAVSLVKGKTKEFRSLLKRI